MIQRCLGIVDAVASTDVLLNSPKERRELPYSNYFVLKWV